MKDYVDYLTAERDRLVVRVAELEAEIATADEITTDYSAVSQSAKEAYEKTLKPDPDGPILDSARVLATAEGLMWGPTVYAVMLKPKDAKPYRLKGVSE